MRWSRSIDEACIVYGIMRATSRGIRKRKTVLKELKYSNEWACNCEVSNYCNKDGQQIQKSNVSIKNRVSERETMNYDLEANTRSKADIFKLHCMKAMRAETHTL